MHLRIKLAAKDGNYGHAIVSGSRGGIERGRLLAILVEIEVPASKTTVSTLFSVEFYLSHIFRHLPRQSSRIKTENRQRHQTPKLQVRRLPKFSELQSQCSNKKRQQYPRRLYTDPINSNSAATYNNRAALHRGSSNSPPQKARGPVYTCTADQRRFDFNSRAGEKEERARLSAGDIQSERAPGAQPTRAHIDETHLEYRARETERERPRRRRRRGGTKKEDQRAGRRAAAYTLQVD